MQIMVNHSFPPVFVSHGSPMSALEPGVAGAFLKTLGRTLTSRIGRPRAILAISAHSLADPPTLLAADRHAAVYDFYGFPPPLYQVRYDVAGAPEVAARAAALMRAAGNAFNSIPGGGLDHGIWTALVHSHPQAEVPVVPLAFPPAASPRALFELGQALAPLADEGVWILASGNMTHNLRLWGGGRSPIAAPEIPESAAFRDWFVARTRARDWPALFEYRRLAPFAAYMHPTDEHLLPWFVAAGAGGCQSVPQRIHDSVAYGILGMDAYAFGPEAGVLT
jgi:4,5-DOPA dioxygenase extradiol